MYAILLSGAYWIGLKFNYKEKVFKWNDNVEDDLRFRNPNDSIKNPCGYIHHGGMYGLSTCDALLHFVCEISGVCDKHTYGENCLKRCSPHCGGPKKACDNVNGSCLLGCHIGYQGEMCDKVCGDNTYGANCSKRCSPNCGGANNSCDSISGSCINGCIDGYDGELCDKADVSKKVKFGMPDLRTIAAICALVIITGLVIISLALSPRGFLEAQEFNVGTGLELAQEDTHSFNNTHLGMEAVSTGQGTEYDGDISNDEEMRSQLF
ncbi:hypothetical protein RRG08_011637 [Elysia crispata]|uniref:C-type lectin domain-containing protein n=1 Tax=Elysia crispata TaxID=231223 RepID=A0AAE1CQK3_9GAST|nr:hypothetical protein RRG08_011637 [Elysia crispata]